uniref:Leucine rich repeat containing 9 n=1 Tax=Nothobranchius furzeri TaxID=105023 RepID=A0A1A8V608_NOTFU
MLQTEKKKMKQQTEDEEVLKKLCLVNGVPYEDIAHNGSSITSLEIFFSGFPRMLGLCCFPNLCQLTIVDQNIERIEGLEGCPLLQELWIVQCRLTEIAGLQNCQQLEKLYLYDNQICEIKDLELLTNLQVLWLNNNSINKIEGLNTLQTLKELNLSDNRIKKIGHSLESSISLEILNLSGNKISSFKELTLLTHLSSLRELALQDPMSTPNPVCLLCNYATHVLYHMPGLQRLDSYDVSNKQFKDAAECAVTKKMMYYNMRVRSAERTLAETRFILAERKKTQMQLPEGCIKTFSQALRSLECELSMLPYDCKKKSDCLLEGKSGPKYLDDGKTEQSESSTLGSDPVMKNKILLKVDALKQRLNTWTRRMHEIEAWYKRELVQATNQTEYTVQFLLMELESVGNIRLEEGIATDPWFTSCCSLLLSRFSPSDYEGFNIADIKINRVLRIHNSALRLRFDDKLHSLINSKESPATSLRNYRQQLDYLFYIADPERCEKEETLCVLEEGFTTTHRHETVDREHAIPMSNNLCVTEQLRIEYLLHQASQRDQSPNSVPFRHGHVIVSKVFVGNSKPVGDGNSYLKVSSVYCDVDTKHRFSLNDGRCSSAKTHQISESISRQRQWFVFDHELVLPEYIMYFEYITEEDKDRSPSKEEILNEAALHMESALKPQPKLFSLNDNVLLRAARANVLSQITVLNLHGNCLSEIKEICSLTALRHLTISCNKLTRLDDISHMPNLEVLDASFNEITTLEGLRGLAQLKQLDVSWNRLTKPREDATVLRKHTPALLRLDTRHNPWSKPEAVKLIILGRLTTLTHLDGDLVTEEETAEAVQMAAASKINQTMLMACSHTSSKRPRSFSLLLTAQLLSGLRSASWGSGGELEPDWAAKITSLNLDNQRISKLLGLNELVNLRWASLNNNHISKLESLDGCLKLEELSINNNSISSLSGLAELRCLNKLSMDENQLSSLDASVLDKLLSLTFLSVENNHITSLQGIQKVPSLLELYVGGNQVSKSRDVYYLKGLTNLIILDLYRNPIVEKLENYRIYVVFHLPSLKALDGTAVDLSECESAKNMFRGRLTSDTIAEKLGHSKYAEVAYLSLQSCSIRMVDLSPPDLFCNLLSINLERNNLTSFSGLIHLPNVKVLCLNHNHVESILPRHKPQTHLTNRQVLHSKVHSSGYGQQSSSRGHRETGPSGSLEPLMVSLEVLHLSHNSISNMANLQLSRLTNLKALFLQDNDISQVEGLEGLQQLRELVLNRNRIKTLTKNSFAAQIVLLELHLAENRIRELNHLNPLTELRKLFLDMNKLQDVTELEKLEVLPSLTELSIVGNPVARNSLHRPAVVLRLNQLQVLDGMMVTLEERTRAKLLNEESLQNVQLYGASLPTTEMSLHGLLPVLPHTSTLRGITLSGGPQNFMHGHDFGSDKKQRNGCFGHNQNTGSNLSTTDARFEGNKFIIPHVNQEQGSRSPHGDQPPHM